MSQPHRSAPDESRILHVPNAARQWASRALRKNTLVTTDERLSALHAAPP
jgi:hypothetical protein